MPKLPVQNKTDDTSGHPLRNQTYAQQATATNTRLAYCSDIRHFLRWGGKLPTDTATLVRYCEEQATRLNPSTLKRRMVALKQFHCLQGFPDPTNHPILSKTLRGIANVHGSPPTQAPALLFEHLCALLQQLNQEKTLSACRDAALIAIGFFAALRGRELLSIKKDDIKIQEEGLILTIVRSKTDQAGTGQSCAIPKSDGLFCPARLLKRWLEILPDHLGCLFVGINRWQQCQLTPLSLQGLNNMLRHRAAQANIPNAAKLSSHSLRRGFATSASSAGASFKSIMKQGRWRHEGTVLRYIEAGQQFHDNAVSKLYEPS